MSPRRQSRIDQIVGLPPYTAAMIPAVWYRSVGTITASIPVEAMLAVHPMVLARDCLLDRVAVEVTIVGTTGAVFRIGIWADSGAGYPGKLILDAGTVDGVTPAAAFRTLTIAQPMKAGLCWVGGAVQGAAGTRPQLRVSNFSLPIVGDEAGAAPVSNANYVGWSQASVTGAFGASFSATKVFAGSVPAIYVRAST